MRPCHLRRCTARRRKRRRGRRPPLPRLPTRRKVAGGARLPRRRSALPHPLMELRQRRVAHASFPASRRRQGQAPPRTSQPLRRGRGRCPPRTWHRRSAKLGRSHHCTVPAFDAPHRTVPNGERRRATRVRLLSHTPAPPLHLPAASPHRWHTRRSRPRALPIPRIGRLSAGAIQAARATEERCLFAPPSSPLLRLLPTSCQEPTLGATERADL